MTISIDFTKAQTITAALALKASAAEAYCDERLSAAATEYTIAAKLFFASGYVTLGNRCHQLATAIDQEAVAIAAGEEDAAGYLASQITSLTKGA
jgi:hypothetical protein